jgi:hypothetical protein
LLPARNPRANCWAAIWAEEDSSALLLWMMLGIRAAEFVRRLPVVMKDAAMAMPLVAAISCEGACVEGIMDKG